MTTDGDTHVYYLRRDDDRTLYELGRHVQRWRRVLGRGRAIRLDPSTPTTRIVALLEAASLEDNWTPDAGSRGLYRLGQTPAGQSTLLTAVVHDVRRWAAGRPFRFIDEQGFADWDRVTSWRLDDAITGSRYEIARRALTGGSVQLERPCSTCGRPGCRPMEHAGWDSARDPQR